MNKKDLFISFLFYLGFAPFFSYMLSKKHNNNPELSIQFRRAMALNFLNFICFVIFIIFWVVLSLLAENYRPDLIGKFFFFYNFLPNWFVVLCYLLLIMLWITCIILIFSKIQFKIPILQDIETNPTFVKFGFVWNIITISVICIVVYAANDSIKIVKTPNRPARVYMLYDDMGFVPRWVLTLGFYRIAKVVNSKFEKNSVAVLPISKVSLDEALKNGEFVFISVHVAQEYGNFGFFNEDRTKKYVYGPQEITKIGIGSNLKYVYLAQCFGGRKKEQWEGVFNPAQVIKTFYSISLFPPHIEWLWFKIPKLLIKTKLNISNVRDITKHWRTICPA